MHESNGETAFFHRDDETAPIERFSACLINLRLHRRPPQHHWHAVCITSEAAGAAEGCLGTFE
jgi:hypothetical protein